MSGYFTHSGWIERDTTAHTIHSHATDDYEKLRTHPIRTISKDVRMLEDALYALRNGSSNITEEFLERTIESLGNELTFLHEQLPNF
mgnify:CR=1 FL=1